MPSISGSARRREDPDGTLHDGADMVAMTWARGVERRGRRELAGPRICVCARGKRVKDQVGEVHCEVVERGVVSP